MANGVKMMVVGSTINDVMKVTPPPPGTLKDEKTASGRVGWVEIRHVCQTCEPSTITCWLAINKFSI